MAPTFLPILSPELSSELWPAALLDHTLHSLHPSHSLHLCVQPRRCRVPEAPRRRAVGERAGRQAIRERRGRCPARAGGGTRREGKGKRRAGGRQQPARRWGPAGKRAARGWVYPLGFLRPSPESWGRERAARAQRLDLEGDGTAGRTLPPPGCGSEPGPRAALKGRGKGLSFGGRNPDSGRVRAVGKGAPATRSPRRGYQKASNGLKLSPTLWETEPRVFFARSV